MNYSVDVLYNVAKDLAFRYLKQHVDREVIKLAIYKSCLDQYITKKTLWNIMPLLSSDGVAAVQCNFRNIGELVAFSESEGYHYDVVFFYGQTMRGQVMRNFYIAELPFVLIYKGEKILTERLPNFLPTDDASHVQGVASRLVGMFTDMRDAVLCVGDAIIMAPTVKRLCRHVIAFGDDPAAIAEIRTEGVILREVD